MTIARTIEELKEELGLNPSLTKQKVEREIAKHYRIIKAEKIDKVWHYELDKKEKTNKERLRELSKRSVSVPEAWVDYYIDFLKENGNYCLSDSQVAWLAPAKLGKSIQLATKRSYINIIKNALKDINLITEETPHYFIIQRVGKDLMYSEISEERFVEGITTTKEVLNDELDMLIEEQGGFAVFSEVDLKAANVVASDEAGGWYTKIWEKEIKINELREIF